MSAKHKKMSGSEPPRAPRTQEERRKEAEEALLQAATNIVASHGTAALTLSEVGAAAGFSRGLPAHYFGSKQGLLIAAATYMRKYFYRGLKRSHELEPGLEALLSRVARYYDFVLEAQVKGPEHIMGPTAFQIILLEFLSNPSIRKPIAEFDRETMRYLATEVRAGIARGEIHADVDPEAEAALILGALRGSIAQWCIAPESTDLIALRDAHCEAVQMSLAA